MVARKSPVDWVRARTLWEADPTMTQADLARMLNVSKKTVTVRVQKEGWKKLDSTKAAKVVRQQAYNRADQRTTDVAKGGMLQPEGAPTEHPDLPKSDVSQTTMEVSIEAKSRILERHRREWDGARNRVYKALQNSDFDQAKLGKITAEALKIIQDGERKAWGLDKEEEGPGRLLFDEEEAGWNG